MTKLEKRKKFKNKAEVGELRHSKNAFILVKFEFATEGTCFQCDINTL